MAETEPYDWAELQRDLAILAEDGLIEIAPNGGYQLTPVCEEYMDARERQIRIEARELQQRRRAAELDGTIWEAG